MNQYEKEFAKVYGEDHFNDLYAFIQKNDILEYYKKARNSDDPMNLFHFGFHYGLVSIVAFCYCHLKLSLAIHEVIDGYFKMVDSTTPEFIEQDGDRQMMGVGTPIIHNPGAKDGMIFATIDKYTKSREKCMNYLLRMIRFSKYMLERKNNKKSVYVYTVVDKYIDAYKLLDVC